MSYELSKRFEKRSEEYAELAGMPKTADEYQISAIYMAKSVAMMEAARIAMESEDV